MTADASQPASGTDVSEVLLAARVDIEDDRVWRARDRLTHWVAEHADRDALDLLGQVLHDMGDLPAAGAVWFGTSRRGDDVDAAVAAWREQLDDDFAAMWSSIPRSVRLQPGPRRLEALRRRARQADDASDRDGSRAALRGTTHEVLSRTPLDGSTQDTDGTVGEPGEDEGGGLDAATLIAWILAAAFVVCAVVGLITVLRWIVPS